MLLMTQKKKKKKNTIVGIGDTLYYQWQQQKD